MNIVKIDQAKLEKEQAKKRLAELLKLLRETDYVVLADYDKDKPEVVAQRAEWRAEVRELEWLGTQVDLEQIESNLDEQIEAIANPTSATALPWQSETTESAQVDEAE